VPGRIKQLHPQSAAPLAIMHADDAQGAAQRLSLPSGEFTIVSEF
jgi:hypothetical protein